MFQKIVRTDKSKTTIIIRLMVGTIFLSEGIQKFLFPTIRGVGRFEKMGFSNPDIWGNLVGFCEILMWFIIAFRSSHSCSCIRYAHQYVSSHNYNKNSDCLW